MGKFGGSEITYGADLDVVFVGDESGVAQKLLGAHNQGSAEGNLPPLDARLRPEGEKGPLVCNIETFAAYYRTRAQPWELQALTRARPVTGPRGEEFMEIARAAWERGSQDPGLEQNIDNMLERIRRDRGSGAEFLNLKTGSGGLVEAEFLTQTLQMRNQVWQTNWTKALSALSAAGKLGESEATPLKKAYLFLRRCESILRRYENTSVSTLPSDPKQQASLSHRMGAESMEAFRREYDEARSTIHQTYLRHMSEKSSGQVQEPKDSAKKKKTDGDTEADNQS
jgi:glutamate-ammonia-ligase adenylyltransferase